MALRICPCGICENTNAPSACPACINSRLIEKYKLLRRLSKHRDNLYAEVQARLRAKHEADQQYHWSTLHKNNIFKLKERLEESENELKEGKEKLMVKREDLDARSHLLAVASAQLAKRQVEQLGQHQLDPVQTHNLRLREISLEVQQRRRFVFRQLCKFFPLKYKPTIGGSNKEASGAIPSWTICGCHLPAGDDPNSVGKQDLAASLGYMLQLLQLAAHYLSAPLLHSALIQGSTSKIWQRSSYWDSSSTYSDEYPLFIPTHPRSLFEEHTFSGKGTSIMGFSTVEGTSDNRQEDVYGYSKYDSSSLQNMEMRSEVRKGIKLLKRSIACVASYGFSHLLVPMPSDMSTFQKLTELMFMLSSKDFRQRSSRNTTNHISSLTTSSMSNVSTMEISWLDRGSNDFKVSIGGDRSVANSFYCIARDSDTVEKRAGENVTDEWNLIEHLTLPPPPSDSEDVEHWTRAMFVDATK